MKKKGYLLSLIFFLLTLFNVVSADAEQKSELRLYIDTPGIARLEGDIAGSDSILLFSRVYSSADHMIKDKLLAVSAAKTDGSVQISYDLYADPLAEAQFIPDFDYQGNEITLSAVYAVASDGVTNIRSDPVYIECYLDTGVVDQHLCSLAGDTACGTAAGVIAMQISYPTFGENLYARMNDMRSYCTLGLEYCAGAPAYFLEGAHISKDVNKYIAEELNGNMIMIDHRVPDKTTAETLIGLLSTGRPAVIEVCYLLGEVTWDFQGISHWITINGFSLGPDGYTFRFSDSITASYRTISSEMLDTSNANVSYGNSGYIPVRYIGAFEQPLFSIE